MFKKISLENNQPIPITKICRNREYNIMDIDNEFVRQRSITQKVIFIQKNFNFYYMGVVNIYGHVVFTTHCCLVMSNTVIPVQL